MFATARAGLKDASRPHRPTESKLPPGRRHGRVTTSWRSQCRRSQRADSQPSGLICPANTEWETRGVTPESTSQFLFANPQTSLVSSDGPTDRRSKRRRSSVVGSERLPQSKGFISSRNKKSLRADSSVRQSVWLLTRRSGVQLPLGPYSVSNTTEQCRVSARPARHDVRNDAAGEFHPGRRAQRSEHVGLRFNSLSARIPFRTPPSSAERQRGLLATT